MFKKDLPRRPAPANFKEPAKEMPPRSTGGFSQEEATLVSELEESLKKLRQAVRQGEMVAGKAAAALADDNND